MVEYPLFDFFFGTTVRYLGDAEPGWLIADTPDTLYVIGNLRWLFHNMERLGLRVSARTNAATALRDLARELEKASAGTTLDREHARTLSENVVRLRETLEAELRGLTAYVVAPKRLDVEKLLGNTAAPLQPGVFDLLPTIAQVDIAEAGKCIAFDRATAAAFHLMRATEAVLRTLYRSLVHENDEPEMWGPMIQALRKSPRAKDLCVLLDHLNHIRQSFRNPTQHPDATYNIEEVQDLWGVSVDAINRMAAATRTDGHAG